MIAKGRKHAAATATNAAKVGERACASLSPPEVDERDREEDHRPELRREAEPEERAAHDRAIADEGREGTDCEQRRPQVEARVEEGAEDERRDADREQHGPRAIRPGADRAQRRGGSGDASGAADAHQHRERGCVLQLMYAGRSIGGSAVGGYSNGKSRYGTCPARIAVACCW